MLEARVLDQSDARRGAAIREARLRLLAHRRGLRGPGSGRDGGAPPVRRRGAAAGAGPVRLRPVGLRREVAWRAALVLLLSVEFVAIGRMALTDATLALWTTVSGYAFMRGWWGGHPRGPWYALAWIAAGLAALAQGPGGTPDPARRRAPLPPARRRPPPGLAGGLAAPRARAVPPGRRAVVRGHVLDPRLGLRGAGARRDDRTRPPASHRAGRDGRSSTSPCCSWASSPGARSCRRPSSRRSARRAPGPGGARPEAVTVFAAAWPPRGPGALLRGADAPPALRPPALPRCRAPRRRRPGRRVSLAPGAESPRRDGPRRRSRSWPAPGSPPTSSCASWPRPIRRPRTRACRRALSSSPS